MPFEDSFGNLPKSDGPTRPFSFGKPRFSTECKRSVFLSSLSQTQGFAVQKHAFWGKWANTERKTRQLAISNSKIILL